MKLRFGEIEQILQIVHEVPIEARSRFRAKIRNLTRLEQPLLSLPSGSTGRKANYDPADLFKIAFALELLQAGVPPEPTAVSVGQHWPDLVEQLFAARSQQRKGKPASTYLVAEPRSLTSSVYRFKSETGRTLTARLTARLESLHFSRLLVINAAALLHKVDLAAQQAGIDMIEFERSLDEAQAIILKHGARVYGND